MREAGVGGERGRGGHKAGMAFRNSFFVVLEYERANEPRRALRRVEATGPKSEGTTGTPYSPI